MGLHLECIVYDPDNHFENPVLKLGVRSKLHVAAQEGDIDIR